MLDSFVNIVLMKKLFGKIFSFMIRVGKTYWDFVKKKETDEEWEINQW